MRPSTFSRGCLRADGSLPAHDAAFFEQACNLLANELSDRIPERACTSAVLSHPSHSGPNLRRGVCSRGAHGSAPAGSGSSVNASGWSSCTCVGLLACVSRCSASMCT